MNTEAATRELPLLLSGYPVVPSSGHGTLTVPSIEPPAMPHAVVVGEGFSVAAYQKIKECVRDCGAEDIAFFRTDQAKSASVFGVKPPTREHLLESVKGALDVWQSEGIRWKEYLF